MFLRLCHYAVVRSTVLVRLFKGVNYLINAITGKAAGWYVAGQTTDTGEEGKQVGSGRFIVLHLVPHTLKIQGRLVNHRF